jgi:hypothetical protein
MAGNCVKPDVPARNAVFEYAATRRQEGDENAYCVVTLRAIMLSSRAFTSGHSESRMLK